MKFPRLRPLLTKAAKTGSSQADEASIARVAWAVSAVSRRIPVDASCLTQALAAEFFLNRLGQPSRLVIGVAKDNGELEAHAWVEIEGRVIIGGNVDLTRFTTLPSIETKAR